jgi:hypothetical protein
VKGKELDVRDGPRALLYEIVTGMTPFEGGNLVEICETILRDEHRPSSLHAVCSLLRRSSIRTVATS